jgi:hypothetical protein
MENLKGRDNLEDLGRDGKIILEWILGKQGQKLWTEFICLRLGLVVGCCFRGYETSGFIKVVGGIY